MEKEFDRQIVVKAYLDAVEELQNLLAEALSGRLRCYDPVFDIEAPAHLMAQLFLGLDFATTCVVDGFVNFHWCRRTYELSRSEFRKCSTAWLCRYSIRPRTASFPA